MWYFGFPPEPPEEDPDKDDNRGHVALGWVLAVVFFCYSLIGAWIFWSGQ